MIYDNNRHEHLAVSDDELEKGFEAVMSSIERLSPEETADLALQAERALLGHDAYALGLEHHEHGNRQQAVHWLSIAARHNVTGAQRKLQEVALEDAAAHAEPFAGLVRKPSPARGAVGAGPWDYTQGTGEPNGLLHEGEAGPQRTHKARATARAAASVESQRVADAARRKADSLVADGRHETRLLAASAQRGRVVVWDSDLDMAAGNERSVSLVTQISAAMTSHMQASTQGEQAPAPSADQDAVMSTAASGADCVAAQPDHTSSHTGHPGGGPTVRRIMLGIQLRRLRESRGITREAAGTAIRASHTKICRIELGRVRVKEPDVADLLTLYGVNDDDIMRQELLGWARQCNTPGWWHQYSDILPSWFPVDIGLEGTASQIRSYEALFIPGLLQTEDYARAVMQGGHPTASAREIERHVAIRIARQQHFTARLQHFTARLQHFTARLQHFTRPGATMLWTIVDEAVLRRPLGGPNVMRSQIEHLIEITERPGITLQVLPFHTDSSTRGGPVTIFRYTEPDLPDIAYLEQLTSALYLDKRQDVDAYKQFWDQLSVAAASPSASTAFLQQLLQET